MAEKIEPKIIKLKNVRLSFARLDQPQARTNRKGQPIGEPKYSASFLLDPSNKEHQETIREIKEEALRLLKHRFGDTLPKNMHLCFGEGNKLEKVYDGYKDMVYVKAADTIKPIVGNRRGEEVMKGEDQYPYNGCYVNARITLWTYDNESKGVSANLRSVQFVRDGEAFGGAARSAKEEFEALGDEDSGSSGGNSGPDPFDI